MNIYEELHLLKREANNLVQLLTIIQNKRILLNTVPNNNIINNINNINK